MEWLLSLIDASAWRSLSTYIDPHFAGWRASWRWAPHLTVSVFPVPTALCGVFTDIHCLFLGHACREDPCGRGRSPCLLHQHGIWDPGTRRRITHKIQQRWQCCPCQQATRGKTLLTHVTLWDHFPHEIVWTHLMVPSVGWIVVHFQKGETCS